MEVNIDGLHRSLHIGILIFFLGLYYFIFYLCVCRLSKHSDSWKCYLRLLHVVPCTLVIFGGVVIHGDVFLQGSISTRFLRTRGSIVSVLRTH